MTATPPDVPSAEDPIRFDAGDPEAREKMNELTRQHLDAIQEDHGRTIAAILEGRLNWAVLRGNCTDVLRGLDDQSVDHVIQDPPYSDHVHSKQRRVVTGGGSYRKGRKTQIQYRPLGFDCLAGAERLLVASHMARVCRRWMLTFSDQETDHLWRDDLVAAGARHIRVGDWVKLYVQPNLTGRMPASAVEAIEIAHSVHAMTWNGGGKAALWIHPIATSRQGQGERVHETQKPLELMMDLVRDFTDPGESVLDPYCGSATTGVACLRLGRRFLGIERDHHHHASAVARLRAEQFGLNLPATVADQLPLLGAR